MTTGIVTHILTELNTVTHQFVFHGYQALVNAYINDIRLAIVLYIAMFGWGVIAGWISLTVSEALKRVLKIAVIYSITTQWAFFAHYVYNVFTQGPNEIAMHLLRAAGRSYFNSNNVFVALQTGFDKGMSLGCQIWQMGGFSSSAIYWLFAAFVWVLTLLIVGFTLLELAAAQLGLAICLVLSPLFVLFYLWQGSKGFFEGWLRHVMSFALVPLFVTAMLVLVLCLMQSTLNGVGEVSASTNLQILTPYLIAGIVSIGLVAKIPHLVAGITSGFSLGLAQSASNFVANRWQRFRSAAWMPSRKISISSNSGGNR